jgi:hypothetical protein
LYFIKKNPSANNSINNIRNIPKLKDVERWIHGTSLRGFSIPSPRTSLRGFSIVNPRIQGHLSVASAY